MSRVKTIAKLALIALACATFSQPSLAYKKYKKTGGSAYAGANSQASIKAKTKYISYSSTTFADAGIRSLYGGQIVEGWANAGNHTEYYAIGKSDYVQHKISKAKVYAKGKSIIAKARSDTYTQIKAAGSTYVVTKEVARALARHTPLGTHAAADSDSFVQASSNGYIGVVSGTKNSAYVRVNN